MSQVYFSSQDISTLDSRYRTQLINSLTGFKSLALIGTSNEEQLLNLALFSQVIHVGAHPPYIGILSRPNSVVRHTLENIRATGVFTINHVQEKFYEAAHLTSARWASSEFAEVGLTAEFKNSFFAPFVKESEIKIGCELNELIDIQSNGTHLVIGEIKHIFLREATLGSDGYVDIEAAGSLTVSGLDSYHRTEKIARLPYAKAKEKLG